MSGRLHDRALRLLIALGAVGAVLVGCLDRPSPEKASGVAPSQAGGRLLDPTVQMTIVVTSVRADPPLDPQALRGALHDAETALLSCADDDGSTGVVAFKIAIEHDGFVGDISLRETTTYGSDDARVCLQRIVGAMRFPAAGEGRAEAEVTLEVQTRFNAR